MITQFFLPSLSKAINSYLKLDPESLKRLEKLSGRAISIELLPLNLIFQCVFTDKGVEIHTNETIPTETQIRGTPLQMMSVMNAKDRQGFFADDLTMEGNAELGQQIVELFDELHIDWEEHFSHVIGDVSAHHVGRIVSKLSSLISKTETSFSQNINEYLHEESDLFPAKEALEDFFTDMDTLRMDVDRAESRINHLKSNLADNEVKP